MEKKWMLRIFCALIALLGLGGVLYAGAGWLPAAYYAAVREATVLDFSEALQQTPAPAADAPEGAVDVLVDGIPVCTVASAEEAAAVLNALLAQYAQAPEGETLAAVRFARAIALGAASAGAQPLDGEAFAALIAQNPALCAVERVTRRVERTPIPYETQAAGEDARLPKGARLVDVGVAGTHRRVVEITTLNGNETGRRVVYDADDAPPAAQQVWMGGYESTRSTPGRSEGEKGPALTITLKRPIAGESISSNFGMREGRMHYGVDYACDAGTPVLAPADGTVIYAGERGAYGGVVELDHGEGLVTRLARLADITVALGEAVAQGGQIAVVAQPEAEEDAPLLHMETLVGGIPYNPRQYLE